MYVSYDLRLGILLKWKKVILIVIVFLLFCINLYSRSRFLISESGEMELPAFIDYFIFIFEGVLPFNPKNGSYFSIPLMWFIYNITLAYIIGDYTTNDLKCYGNNVLIRIKSRTKWWFSKCLWTTLTVVIYFIIGYITIFIFSIIISKDISFVPNIMNRIYFTLNDSNMLSGPFIFMIFILPIIVSLALSLLQIALSLIFNSIISFTTIIALLTSSIYLDNCVLIGNGSMIARNALMNSSGTQSYLSVIIAIAISIVSILVGLIYFRRYDVLSKG